MEGETMKHWITALENLLERVRADTKNQEAAFERAKQRLGALVRDSNTHPLVLKGASDTAEALDESLCHLANQAAALEHALELQRAELAWSEAPKDVNEKGRAPAPWSGCPSHKPDHHHVQRMLLDAQDNPIALVLVLDTPQGREIADTITHAEELAQALYTVANINTDTTEGEAECQRARELLRKVGLPS